MQHKSTKMTITKSQMGHFWVWHQEHTPSAIGFYPGIRQGGEIRHT